MTSQTVQYIPYAQIGEPARRAAIVQVSFPIEGLTDSDLQVLGHLSEAVDLMNPIYRDQFEPKTVHIAELAEKLMNNASSRQREEISNYLAILNLQNSPFSLLPRKNHLLGLPREEAEELAKKSGVAAEFEALATFFYDGLTLPDKAGFYPPDMTEDEWNALGEDANIVNLMFTRRNGKIHPELNETRYASSLKPVIEHLLAARDASTHPEFRVYLDSKIEELRHGTKESRRIADYLWIKHNSPIDLILSTALEVYLDNWKNARGEAAGAVYRENSEAQDLLTSLVDHLPKLESSAPWTHKKLEIDRSKLPHLRFVDVLNWSGDYVNSPMTIIAQSLPNDDWVTANLGSVNLVYRNTGKAVHSVSGDLMAEEFLARGAYEQYREYLFEASQVHSALHELGHTTGAMDPDHKAKQARDYLESEYSPLEEARAELFGMFAMDRIAKEGIVSGLVAGAGHYSMLVSMVQGLRFVPEQAHVKARNMMFHYLRSRGGIVEVEEDGKRKFRLDFSHLDEHIEDMLGTLGNLKASGDKAGAAAFREQFCFTDPLREDVQQRTLQFPLGRGLIFPSLKKDGGRYLGQLEYPTFVDQPKFKARLV